ncbi:hypothetical protein BC629DRAFT_1255719, partial [Irpex lacteus]
GSWGLSREPLKICWPETLKKVNAALTRWGKCNPTMRGKRLIVQMIVAGMTQYLAKAQGMPPQIESQLQKTIRNFIWDDAKTSPINLHTLTLPIKDGGIKLLDLRARNEAIELTWLRSYLDLSGTRPIWAYVADVLIAKSTAACDRNTLLSERRNTFIQTWHASTRKPSALPESLKTMLKIAEKYQANFHAIKLSSDIKENLPMWYH